MKQAVPTIREACPGCGARLEQPPGAGRRRLWCGENCRKRDERKRFAEELRVLRAVAEAAYKAAQYRPR